MRVSAIRNAAGVLIPLLVAFPSAAFGLLEDEMVPEGKWFFRASIQQATHQEFFDRGKNEGTLHGALACGSDESDLSDQSRLRRDGLVASVALVATHRRAARQAGKRAHHASRTTWV